MKFRLFAAVALALALSRPAARGGTPFDSSPSIYLTSVSVVVSPSGRASYRFAGVVSPSSGPNLEFTGQCAYDPQQRTAQESLVETKTGSVIQTKTTCPVDPWRTAVSCTGGQLYAPGFSPAATAVINNMSAPISAAVMSDADHQAIDAAYKGQVALNAAAADKAAADKAAAAKAAADKAEAARRAKLAEPVVAVGTPRGSDSRFVLNTPTPDPHTIAVVPVKGASGSSKLVIGTPAPGSQYPLYGATYSSNAVLAILTVNQTVFVPVTVKNLSSQAWPSGGVFHLAYHWYRGSAEIVHEGARTLMPAAVAPGASVTLNARVVAPSSAGASALRWDMVQENVAWFSDKGVAMSAPQSVSVNP